MTDFDPQSVLGEIRENQGIGVAKVAKAAKAAPNFSHFSRFSQGMAEKFTAERSRRAARRREESDERRHLLNLRDFIYTAYRYAAFPTNGADAAKLYRNVPEVDNDHVRSALRFLTDYLAELERHTMTTMP